MIMEEKKIFNAREGLKGHDAVSGPSQYRFDDLKFSEPISKEEWEDYKKAKEECEARGGNWRSERSREHDRMALIYYQACKEYEKRYDQ